MDWDAARLVSNIFISFIGAGILGLPYAFKKSGLIEGVIVMSFVSYLSVKGMIIFLECKHALISRKKLHSDNEDNDADTKIDVTHHMTSSNVTHSDVAFVAFGDFGRRVIDASIFISHIGFCCAYLIFISENLSAIFPSIDKQEFLAMILPVMFLLSLVPDLNKLAVFSFFAQLSNLLAFVVVFWFDFEHLHLANAKHRKEFSIKGFPFFFSIAIYCFEGVGMIFSLEQSIPERLKSNFRQLFVRTLTVVTILYISFGASGYLSFGPRTKDIITLNLPHSSSGLDFAILVKSCLCISLFVSYPVMLFPVTSLLKKWTGDSGATYRIKYASIFVRLILVCLTGFIVVLVPNFSDLMALVGATCCTLLGFIIPGLSHLKICGNDLTFSQRILDYVLVITGVLGAVLGTMDAVKAFR